MKLQSGEKVLQKHVLNAEFWSTNILYNRCRRC